MHQQVQNAQATKPLLGVEKVSDRMSQYGSAQSQQDRLPDFPMPTWTRATKHSNGQTLPQAIAHRGYKAEHAENTMRAFQGAVDVGTHAIETDIHLTKDGVVVLSHDGDLKRCFGQKEKIIDCDWKYLKSLRTLKAPHEPMPRLKDLLEYIAQPGLEHIWILLDIKLDNNADDVMRLIAETLASVDPGQRPWKERVVLGFWVAKFLPHCTKYLPGYPLSHIGWSTTYARQFLGVDNISFNMLQKVLHGPCGARFIRDVRKANRPLFLWTVNAPNIMRWCIQKQVDGVITDDPKTFKKICEEWKGEEEPRAKATWYQMAWTVWIYIMVAIFTLPFRRRFPETVEQLIKAGDLQVKASAKIGQL